VAGRRRGPEAAADRFMTYTCGYSDGSSAWDQYPEDRKDVLRANGRAMLTELRAAGKDRHLNARTLGALTMPVTIAHGERTQSFFATCARATAKLIPHARSHAIPGGNHALAYTAPEATAALIRETAGVPVGAAA
jgi:pimeloyl-ACP methyl ester carboxylesterase